MISLQTCCFRWKNLSKSAKKVSFFDFCHFRWFAPKKAILGEKIFFMRLHFLPSSKCGTNALKLLRRTSYSTYCNCASENAADALHFHGKVKPEKRQRDDMTRKDSTHYKGRGTRTHARARARTRATRTHTHDILSYAVNCKGRGTRASICVHNACTHKKCACLHDEWQT